MKIAIQNPHIWVRNSWKTLHAYNWSFLLKYSQIIFLPKIKLKDLFLFFIWVIKNRVPIYKYKVVFNTDTLNITADMLICFNGAIYNEENIPPKEFNWIKIAHLMDYVHWAKKSYENLTNNWVDYVLWYGNHWKYDKFFQEYFSKYKDKVITTPFSYSKRFKSKINFGDRINKCVALWAVRLVDDNTHCIKGQLDGYKDFFKNEKYHHKMRALINENLDSFSEEIDSYMPKNWKQEKWDYDIVEVYNKYKMFTSCESIINFPSVKTYEWMACWSVFVCSDHECYDEIWLIDWVNCIKYENYNLQSLRDKIQYYQSNPKKLEEISKNWYLHITNNYNPNIIAEKLYKTFLTLTK